eukprot:Sdes_comp9405_c0_seq1m871
MKKKTFLFLSPPLCVSEQTIRSPTKPFYFPIYYFMPITVFDRDSVYLYDLYSSPARQAVISTAISTNTSLLSNKLNLITSSGVSNIGVLVVTPLYNSNHTLTDPNELNAANTGMLVTVLQAY